MGTITSQMAFGRNLCILRVSGEIEEQELLSWMEELSGGAFAAKSVLWDFSDGALTCAFGDGGPGAFLTLNNPDKGQIKPRTAVLAPNEIDFGLQRILRACSTTLHYPAEIRIFRSVRAAMLWLGICRICPSARQPAGKPQHSCRTACLTERSSRLADAD
jgi:hypothetical protein